MTLFVNVITESENVIFWRERMVQND